MTALTQYQRLECIGLWRENPQAQRRNVAVCFGDSSLMITDLRSNVALTHWSLPAIERLNPNQRPALFAPSRDAVETLELEEDAMINALETVHHAIDSQRTRPGRLRFYVAGGGLALVLGLAVFWMPDALYRHTASVVPPSKRAEIGRLILNEIAPTLGIPCTEPAALDQLAALHDRLMPPGDGELIVVAEGLETTAYLPGGVILLNRSLVEPHESPDIAAGYILAELLRADLQDPMLDLLRSAGIRATFALLTTGNLPTGATDGYGTAMLAAPRPPVADDALLARFAAAGVSSSPYAFGLDPTGETTLGLIEADPFRAAPAPQPVLSDDNWVALQGICSI